jgi:hypothetical protein
MKMEDLNLKIGDKLPFDVTEDLMVFMRNEPNFYRKSLYPALVDCQEAVKNGGKFDKKSMLPMIEKAVCEYIKKYDIKKRPNQLLDDQEKMECISRLLKDEADNFREGMY